MGRISTDLFRQQPSIPTTTGGPGQDFGQRAIARTGAANQRLAQGGMDLGRGLMALSKTGARDRTRADNANDAADLARYEQAYEELDNQRYSIIARTKDVATIKKANDDFERSIEGILAPGYSDEQGIPLFRSATSKNKASNSWLKGQGDVRRSNIRYLQLLDREATNKRLDASDATSIKNATMGVGEQEAKARTLANAQSLLDGGYVSEEEAADRIKFVNEKIKESALTNALASIENDAVTSNAAEVTTSELVEQVSARKDLTDKEKKAFKQEAYKIVERKRAMERANANEDKYKRTKYQYENTSFLLSTMNDDGTLNVSNEDLRKGALQDAYAPGFVESVIAHRAKGDALARKQAMRKKYDDADLAGKLQLDAEFEGLWDEVRGVAVFPPTGKELADLHSRIALYKGHRLSVLSSELKTQLARKDEPTDEEPYTKLNKDYVDAFDGNLRSMLGVGFTTKKGKKVPQEPREREFGKAQGKLYQGEYDDRIIAYSAIMEDARESAKTMNPQELEQHVKKNPAYAKLIEKGLSEQFYESFNQWQGPAPAVPESEKATFLKEPTDKKLRKVRIKETGEIVWVDENNEVVKESK